MFTSDRSLTPRVISPTLQKLAGRHEDTEQDRSRGRSARWVSRRRDLAVTTLAGSAYLTLQELAAYANVSVRTLRKFLTLPPAQALPAYRPGRKVLVRRDEFDAWFAQYRTRGRPALTRNLRALGFHPEQLDGT